MANHESLITATHLKTGERLHLNDVQREYFYAGGGFAKALVTGRVHEGTPLSLVARDNCLHYANKWQTLEGSGIPVAPDAYALDSGEDVLVADVKADGSELYGKAFLNCLQFQFGRRGSFRRRPEMDPLFLEATHLKVRKHLGELAFAYADLATTRGFSLPTDETFELRIRPCGNHSLMLLDLDRVNLSGPNESLNFSVAQSFIDNTVAIRNLLIRRQ